MHVHFLAFLGKCLFVNVTLLSGVALASYEDKKQSVFSRNCAVLIHGLGRTTYFHESNGNRISRCSGCW
jgi:hypothetical protein